VDRAVDNSHVLTDVKETFFNGDPEFFKGQLSKWVADFGIRTEDLRNLTLSALFAKLIASTDDSGVQGLMRSALAAVKDKGLGNVKASEVVKS